MKTGALITVQQITEQARMLKQPSTRNRALATLLDKLGEYAQRNGWRQEGTRVRTIAKSIDQVAQLEEREDESGLGHDDPRQKYAMIRRVAERHLGRNE